MSLDPEQLRPLPVTHEALIPEDYRDMMGHMNVMWYTHLFTRGTTGLWNMIGLTKEYFRETQAGTFQLEEHVHYLNEVRIGQHVTIRTRVLARSAKRIHYQHFMTNDDVGKLAATAEIVATHVDLQVRRSAPLPDQVAAALDRLLAEHTQLDWAAPVCGVMKA